MSDFRWDTLRGCWVIMLNSRQRQPREFMIERQQSEMLSCPFCPGQEAKTPHEVYALRMGGLPADSAGWQVRVVPNKFPILRIEGELRQQQQGLHQSLPGIGAHEVIIETSDHDRTLADLEVSEIVEVLKAYRARLLDLRRDPRFRYLQIFKGHGIEAGAPVPHSHSQLIAVPIVPPLVQDLIQNSHNYFDAHQSCLNCDLISQESAMGDLIVFRDDRFVAMTPFASRFPFETRLLPVGHQHDFALQNDDDLTVCAAALRTLLRKLRVLLDDPPYNLILHTAPPTDPANPGTEGALIQSFHWHIELVPRLNRIAGFEWGSGFYINPMLPEHAARFLRETDPDSGTR